MPIKCDHYNHVCVIAVEPELCGEEAARMRQMIEDLMDHRQTNQFLIDLENAKFIDSSGLETLLWARRRCDSRSGQFKLAAADPNCRKILEITRLADRFECHADVPTALKTMGRA